MKYLIKLGCQATTLATYIFGADCTCKLFYIFGGTVCETPILTCSDSSNVRMSAWGGGDGASETARAPKARTNADSILCRLKFDPIAILLYGPLSR
jgi:hypothetical protein